MAITDFFARLGGALFGGPADDSAGEIDGALLEQVVDAVVDAVDPRLRLMPRYRARLTPAVTRSIRLLRSLAPRLPEPIELSRAAWATDPNINAFFATGSEAQTLLDHSAELRAFFEDPANSRYETAHCVLGMRREDRNVLASALIEGEVRREVPRTTVSFAGHTLFGITGEASLTRGRLGEAILSRVAGIALERIVATRDRATELETRKSVLAAKLRMLNLRRGKLQPLATGEEDPVAAIAAIERELATIVENHMEAKASLATLDYSFAQTEAVLGEPTQYLGLTTTALRLSHTGYKLDAGSSEPAAELRLNELWIGSNLRAVIVPVYVPRPTPRAQQPH